MAEQTYFDALQIEYQSFLDAQSNGIDPENCLRIDLHCHDHNSDKPDELWGRLLRLPETWLKTKTLLKQLERSGSNLFTITNHNNARSCWPLAEQRDDILVGAEFTCHFPDLDLSVHVLCYDFTQQQELELNELRHDAYAFVRYARREHLPLVLPHPLFFYSRYAKPSLEILERFAVMFERFEVLNGQRGVWQNLLTKEWVESLTPDLIDQYANKHNLDPKEFCFDPYNKRMTGGSDDHNGLFAGQCGTLLPVHGLQRRLAAGERKADIAREALLYGKLVPFGQVGEEEKLTTTFLDYFAQVVLNMKDPGLIRLFLHKGDLKDKLACLAISNGIQELQRHNYTLKFLETFHDALQGKKPALLVSLNTTKEFKPVLQIVKAIAKAKRKEPENFATVLRQQIPLLQHELSLIFFERLNKELGPVLAGIGQNDDQLRSSLKQFELPTHFRRLVGGQSEIKQKNMSNLNLGALFDQLSFPALAAGLVLGAGFLGTQVLYSNREFITELSDSLGRTERAERVLWLTDTLVDKNGVSTVLQQTLAAVRELHLPIDILTCHPKLESADNLHVIKPISELRLPNFDDQVIYVPDILRIQKIFERGGYDRIICSTELLMGGVALYLKHAFSVPAHFFMHTDWMEYANQRLNPSLAMQDRLRRLLRGFYQQFDRIITLNETHQQMLTGPGFELPTEQVYRSAHWASETYLQASHSQIPVQERPLRVIYAGRLSSEKGVNELPAIWSAVTATHPNAELVIAGTGPLQQQLERALPQARFTGWLSPHELVDEYRSARCQILPSTFDTFGCVIIEAMCLGVPTFAYNTKGPATIITTGQNGFLADNTVELSEQLCEYLDDEGVQIQITQQASKDAEHWRGEIIMQQLLADLYQ